MKRETRTAFAIVVGFVALIGVMVGYNAYATDRERPTALVVDVTARQRTLTERYIKDTVLALDAMRQRYPAQHYVMIDDKPRLLAAMKRALGEKLTTVFVHQGHYAAESADTIIDPPPDLEIERIGDLLDHDLPDFLAASPVGVAATNQERP